jgi:hypothetical protein
MLRPNNAVKVGCLPVYRRNNISRRRSESFRIVVRHPIPPIAHPVYSSFAPPRPLFSAASMLALSLFTSP